MKNWLYLIVGGSISGWMALAPLIVSSTGPVQAQEAAACAASHARNAFLSGYLPVEGAKPVSSAAFIDGTGNSRTVEEWQGRPLLMNFWATWCPPCVKELPSLSRLKSQLKSAGVDVVAINVDKDDATEVSEFLSSVDARNLEPFRDPGRSMMKSARIASLPTTLLINADGHEVAAVLQDAKWDEPSIAAFIASCLGNKKTPGQ